MILLVVVTVFSFFLDAIASTFPFFSDSIFVPLFTLMAIIVLYPYIDTQKYQYYIYCFILGLFYDSAYTDTMFLYAYLFLGMGVLIHLVHHFFSYNWINLPIIVTITIILYRTITYSVLVMVGYLSFSFPRLIESIYVSLCANIIYVYFLYFITKKAKSIFKITTYE